MRKIVYGLLLSTAGTLMADGDTYHSLSPKLFYQNHAETDYEYEIFGVGFQYRVESPKGIGFKSSICTNLSKDEPLSYVESEMYYRKNLSDTFSIFPNIQTKVVMHTLDGNEERILFTTKSSHYFGLNLEKELPSAFKINVGAHLFKNFSNNVTVKKNNDFFGQSYENPFGLKLMGSMAKEWKKEFSTEIGGYFAKTFKKEFRTYGFDLTFKWDF